MKLRMPPQSWVLTPGILLGTIISATIVLTASADLTNCTPPPSGLVGWWPGEGNANDRVGTNNGTLRGGATFAAGEVGQAFSFDGVTGSVMVPDAPALHFTNAMTVEAWVNPKAIGGHFQEVVSKWFGNNNQLSFTTSITPQGQAYLLVSSDGQTSVLGGDYMLVYTTNSIPANHWTHFAATYDGAWLKAYLNGAFENQVPWTNGIFPGTGPLFIGEDYSESLFNGLIDEVSLYSRALSDSEITAIYNAGSAGKCPPATPSILTQPASQTVLAGASATFTVTATGTPPMSYQWRFSGTNIAGAAGTSLTLSNMQPAQAGIYTVQVTNAYGSTNSANALLTVSNPPPLCAPPASGLVAWWPGEGNANDQAGTNSGTLLGEVAFAPALVGQAFSFNGSSGLVVVPDAPVLRFTTSMTIEAWIYLKAYPSGANGCEIISKWFGNGNQNSYTTSVDSSGKAYLLVSCDGLSSTPSVDYGIVDSTHGVPLKQWTHFAATYDGATLSVYLNGVLENQASWTKGLFPGTAPLVIGANYVSSVFNGLIDEASLYNRTLSGTEIQAVYNAGSEGKCHSGTAPSITAQPASQTVLAGATATFSVTATGTPPLSYQWRFGGTNIAGATGTSLTLSNVQPAQVGIYAVQVTNAYGSTNSANALLSVTNPPPVCAPPPSGLVAWWPGEGAAYDQAGTNSGTLVGGSAFAPGRVGQAFSFDGINGYVSVPKAPSLDVGSQLTIDFWMKADPSNPMNTVQGLVVSDFYVIEISSGLQPRMGVNFGVSTNSGAYVLQTSEANGGGAVISAGVWHHVAATYDGAKLQLYIDGQPWGNPTLVSGAISPMLANSFVAIGSEDGRTSYPSCASSRYFKGLIDEVDIFNRALSASEIGAIYNAGSAGKCGLPPSILAQPQAQTAVVGSSVTFAVAASGTPPLGYQWLFNGTNLTEATSTTLTVTNIQLGQAGSYTAQVTNLYGLATSSNAVLTVNLTPLCAPPPSGLVSWWRGEGDGLDAAGTNNATLQNGASFAAGRVGQAFSFDGINDSVNVPKTPSLDVGSQLTIDFWMKADPSNPMNTLQGLVASDFYAIEISSGLQSRMGVNFGVSTNSGAYVLQTSEANGGGAVISSGAWHHVAGTYDGARLQLYIDGQPWGNPTLVSGAISPMLAGSFVSIGSEDGRRFCGSCTANRYFKGLMDEVDIFNRALSASEIAAIYSAGSAGKCGLPPTILVPPQSQAVLAGSSVTFRVTASGNPPFNYQWRYGGTDIAGATNASLTLSNLQPGNAGSYSVIVSNGIGSATSSEAVLKVNVVIAYGNGLPLTNAEASFGGPVTVQLQNVYSNGLIFFTLDGSTPTFASTQYTGPFIVSRSVELRALGYSLDFTQSGQLEPTAILIVPVYSLVPSTSGGGSIALHPAGGSYFSNTIVGVTATAASGWRFLQWLGDLTGTNPVASVTMGGNKRVQAVFGTTLSTTAAGGGSVVVSPAAGLYPYGSIVALTAIPQPGRYFGLWGNAASGNVNPLYFTITNPNRTVSCLFAALPGGQAALAVTPSGNGKVTVNPRANVYTLGTVVTLTAAPDEGQSFLGWTGDASGTTSPLSITMDQSKIITASFSRKPVLTAKAAVGSLTDQGFGLTLDGELGGAYRIDSSTSLVDWLPLMTVTNPYGRVQFVDPSDTSVPRRFYRAVQLP